MKRQFLFAAGIVMAGSLFLVSSCSKNDGDTTAPTVTLNGNSSQDVILNSSYTDLGATASDAEDGTVSVSTNNPVNVDSAGTYTVTYTATDAAGNTGTATRSVRVYNESEGMAGSYLTVENNVDSFYQDISASNTHNKRIVFSKFANYVNNNKIYANIVGNSVDMPQQVAVGIGPSGCTHTFTDLTGGNSLVQNQGKYTFSIKFTDQEANGGGNCPGTGLVTFEDVFVQQ